MENNDSEIQQREENLWKAIDVAKRAWQEVEAMATELSSLFIQRTISLGKLEEGNRYYGGGVKKCMHTVRLDQWELKPVGKRGNPKSIGYLCAVTVLNGQWKLPYLIVGYCDTDGKDPFEEAWEFFDRDYDEDWKEDEKESGYEWKIRADGKLITLKDQDSKLHAGNDVEWYFALPLLALNHVEDLEKLVIRPAIGLLQGNEDEIKNNPQALKFVLEEGIPRLKEKQPRADHQP